MIPLIIQTPRLIILAASRALLTAELHKPQYFSMLLGATVPPDWPLSWYGKDKSEYFLAKLTAGARGAAGWYNWYALRKADGQVPRALVGMSDFMGAPDAAGIAEISFAIVADWQGQGLATELVDGLMKQAAATGMIKQLIAHTPLENLAAQAVLLRNGFVLVGTAVGGKLRFERAVVPAADPQLQDPA